MLVAVRPFLLSSRRSAHCRWASSLGRGALTGLLSWLDVTSPSAAYVSICHLAFSRLWEVEIRTQPCFRRMTWTCQTADKAKNLSMSEFGENTPPQPSKFAFISVLGTAVTQVSTLSLNYLACKGCPLYWGAVWNVQGFWPATEKGGREVSACCHGKGRTLLAMPGGKARAAVDVAVGEWLESDVL